MDAKNLYISFNCQNLDVAVIVATNDMLPCRYCKKMKIDNFEMDHITLDLVSGREVLKSLLNFLNEWRIYENETDSDRTSDVW